MRFDSPFSGSANPCWFCSALQIKMQFIIDPHKWISHGTRQINKLHERCGQGSSTLGLVFCCDRKSRPLTPSYATKHLQRHKWFHESVKSPGPHGLLRLIHMQSRRKLSMHSILIFPSLLRQSRPEIAGSHAISGKRLRAKSSSDALADHMRVASYPKTLEATLNSPLIYVDLRVCGGWRERKRSTFGMRILHGEAVDRKVCCWGDWSFGWDQWLNVLSEFLTVYIQIKCVFPWFFCLNFLFNYSNFWKNPIEPVIVCWWKKYQNIYKWRRKHTRVKKYIDQCL